LTVKVAQYDPSLTYNGQKKFDCGNAIINKYVYDNLKKHVRQSLCAAYALLDCEAQDRFIGFYTLAQHSISLSSLSVLELGGLPKQIPCTRLVMLGVAISYKGQGWGKKLMKDALVKAKTISDQIGSYGVYLDADQDAVNFYLALGFILLEDNKAPYASPMFLPMTRIP
jgi:predicted GNAT family N-acyltransferase